MGWIITRSSHKEDRIVVWLSYEESMTNSHTNSYYWYDGQRHGHGRPIQLLLDVYMIYYDRSNKKAFVEYIAGIRCVIV